MSYVSATLPDTARGPHEHGDQTDLFCFMGPSTFKIYIWDNRRSSATYQHRIVLSAGEDNPKTVLIPPGVVHAYKNIGNTPGIVLNYPNRLYRGHGKQEPVDEIRHEDDEESIFKLD